MLRGPAQLVAQPAWVGRLGSASFLDSLPPAGGCARAGCLLCRATALNGHPDRPALRRLLQQVAPRALESSGPANVPDIYVDERCVSLTTGLDRSPIRDVLTELTLRQATVEGVSFVQAAQEHLAAVGASRVSARQSELVQVANGATEAEQRAGARGGGRRLAGRHQPAMRRVPMSRLVSGRLDPRSVSPEPGRSAMGRAPTILSKSATDKSSGSGSLVEDLWHESFWPEWGDSPDECAPAGEDRPAEPEWPYNHLVGGTFTVDGSKTTSGTGTWLDPFSITQVRRLLFKRWSLPGTTFRFKNTGASWTSSKLGAPTWSIIDGTAMLCVRACGGPGAPLRIMGMFATSGSTTPTTLDGELPDDSTASRFGIALVDALDVLVHNLKIVGFKRGIAVLGQSRRVAIEYLESAWNAMSGVYVSAGEKVSEISEVGDDYPACILVEGCDLHDNGCGCHSGATQVSIALAATNVTVRGCALYCTDSDRGTDGITTDKASSGHIIEYNEIFRIPFLRKDPDCGSSCSGNSNDANDGDGMDLKEVRPRTALSGDRTVVRYNAVHHCDGNGIMIQQGSQGFEVYANEVFCCGSHGITVQTGKSNNAEDQQSGVITTGDVNIYRNLVYGLTGENSTGIKVVSGGENTLYSVAITGVRVVNNTVDNCPYYAIMVAKSTTDKSVITDITLMNNILSRSNYPGKTWQLNLNGQFDQGIEVPTFVLDGNLYVPSGAPAADPRSDVEVVRATPDQVWTGYDSLTMVKLWSATVGAELSWTGRGDSAADPLNPTMWSSKAVVDSNYRPVIDSPALLTGAANSGVLHYETGTDVLFSYDFFGDVPLFRAVVGAVTSLFWAPARNRKV